MSLPPFPGWESSVGHSLRLRSGRACTGSCPTNSFRSLASYQLREGPSSFLAGVKAAWASYLLGQVLCCLHKAANGLLGLAQCKSQGFLGGR